MRMGWRRGRRWEKGDRSGKGGQGNEGRGIGEEERWGEGGMTNQIGQKKHINILQILENKYHYFREKKTINQSICKDFSILKLALHK